MSALDLDVRMKLYRIEMRVAQQAGEYLATHQSEPMEVYFMPLLQTWGQIRKLRETGKLVPIHEIRLGAAGKTGGLITG